MNKKKEVWSEAWFRRLPVEGKLASLYALEGGEFDLELFNFITGLSVTPDDLAQWEIEPKKRLNKKPTWRFDFESIYKMYPRKEGKARGISRLESMIKTQEDYDDLLRAVKNASHRLSGREKEFIPHFSTWVGNAKVQAWRDDIEGQTVMEETESHPQVLVIADLLDQAFMGVISPRMKTAPKKIFEAFGSADVFNEYINAVLSEELAQEKNPSWRTYVEGRIMTQLRSV